MSFDSALIPDVLVPVTRQFIGDSSLTPSERAEVVRMAQGFACKDSAAAANVSPETIRARRKRIYRKLDLSGASELLAALLAFSLDLLAKGEPVGRSTAQQPASGAALHH
jgi:DNA-binding CsgD family transcriptional regulator